MTGDLDLSHCQERPVVYDGSQKLSDVTRREATTT